MVYALSYELKSVEKDYAPFFHYLEHQLGKVAIHVLRDTWWISSDNELDVNAVCDEIRKLIAEKDRFYLYRLIDKDINGWLASSSWDFFKDNH